MTVRLEGDEKELINAYAKAHGMTSSQLMRRCTLESIEEELDAEEYRRAKAAYEADPVTYTYEEVRRALGV